MQIRSNWRGKIQENIPKLSCHLIQLPCTNLCPYPCSAPCWGDREPRAPSHVSLTDTWLTVSTQSLLHGRLSSDTNQHSSWLATRARLGRSRKQTRALTSSWNGCSNVACGGEKGREMEGEQEYRASQSSVAATTPPAKYFWSPWNKPLLTWAFLQDFCGLPSRDSCLHHVSSMCLFHYDLHFPGLNHPLDICYVFQQKPNPYKCPRL